MTARCHIFALLFALAALPCIAQPATTWLERCHDMGVIEESGGKVSGRFAVVNSGDEPLFIVKAQAGCGCTAVDYPDEAIMPGDTAAVTVTYNPSGRPGLFSKQVLVFTNTVPKRTVLEVTGNVIPTQATLNKQYPLRAGALRVSRADIPFGEIMHGKTAVKYLSAYNASTDTLVVTVAGGKPHITPAVVPDTVPPARVTAITVHYQAFHAPQWGFNVDTLTLVSRPLHEAKADTAAINVMAQVLEDFSSLSEKEQREAPEAWTDCGDRLDYGAVNAGQTVTRTFKITNKGKRQLAIRRLWVPANEGVSVSIDRQSVKRGKAATVTVTVDTSRQRGEMLNVPLTVMCNDPSNPRMTIRLVGLINQQR